MESVGNTPHRPSGPPTERSGNPEPSPPAVSRWPLGAQVRLSRRLRHLPLISGTSESESGCLGPSAPGVYPEIALILLIPMIYTASRICLLPSSPGKGGEGRGGQWLICRRWSLWCGGTAGASPGCVSSPQTLMEPQELPCAHLLLGCRKQSG